MFRPTFFGGRGCLLAPLQLNRSPLKRQTKREVPPIFASFDQRQTVFFFFSVSVLYLSTSNLFGLLPGFFNVFHIVSRFFCCKVYFATYSKNAPASLKTACRLSLELSPKDYCAGRGGKTWYLATLVAPNGTVCAWDIEEDLRKQLEGARAKRTLGELGVEFFGCGRFMFAWFLFVL